MAVRAMRASIGAAALATLLWQGTTALAQGPVASYSHDRIELQSLADAIAERTGRSYVVDDGIAPRVSVQCPAVAAGFAPVVLAATVKFLGLRFNEAGEGTTKIVRSYTPSATSLVQLAPRDPFTACVTLERGPLPADRMKAVRSFLSGDAEVVYLQEPKLLVLSGERDQVLRAVSAIRSP